MDHEYSKVNSSCSDNSYSISNAKLSYSESEDMYEELGTNFEYLLKKYKRLKKEKACTDKELLDIKS